MRASKSRSQEDEGRRTGLFAACTFFLAQGAQQDEKKEQHLVHSITRCGGRVAESVSSDVTHIIALRDVRDLKESHCRTDLVAAAATGSAAIISARWVEECIQQRALLAHVCEDKLTTLPLWNVLDHRHCFVGVHALFRPCSPLHPKLSPPFQLPPLCFPPLLLRLRFVSFANYLDYSGKMSGLLGARWV